MEAKKAQALRKMWGNQPCNHPETEKERILGADTGDKVCSTCGEVVEYMGKDKQSIFRKK